MVELSVNIGRDCGGEMADLEAEIITRCQALGLGRCGLGSIRNFIATAFYHASLPGTLPADRHVAFNSAIRFATNRIACQGRDGASIWGSRVLSRRAYELRQALLTDDQPDRAKVKAWTQAVTFEHQDPVWEVQDWIDKDDRIGVDDVIRRLLVHPAVVILREEDKKIPGAFRSRGRPEERYEAAGIEVMTVGEGTGALFRAQLWPDRPQRKTKYHWPFEPFDVSTSASDMATI